MVYGGKGAVVNVVIVLDTFWILSVIVLDTFWTLSVIVLVLFVQC